MTCWYWGLFLHEKLSLRLSEILQGNYYIPAHLVVSFSSSKMNKSANLQQAVEQVF